MKMHSFFPYSILTVLCSLLLCTSSKQYFGVEDTNTGYHFYDVDIQTNVLQGYIYRRGKVVRRMAPSEVETVQQELEYMMDRIYRELTGGKLQNCCKVIHVKNDSIGFFVEMVLPEGTNSSAAVEQLELHNAVLKMGLEIANSDHVELLIYGLVYNNEQVVPWSEEYKNVCGASYEQVTSELKKLIQSALGNGSNFSSTITEKLNKGRRYGYRYDSTSSPTTQTSIDFRRARLCPFQSMLAARVTIDVSDEVIKKLDRSEVYKEISEAIFAEGIRHITTDHFTFLRTGNRHTIVDC
ncbi:hypothetical protein D915_004813 [Fasciola hepatica]|uniref:Uncharacterized protein n=1 Tax=Fasciola hepatica TaxID=6192 RepID=A0A4E0R725_FASHE|nr:hypothetical protein D915_004813 [Fasciola hepatica]